MRSRRENSGDFSRTQKNALVSGSSLTLGARAPSREGPCSTLGARSRCPVNRPYAPDCGHRRKRPTRRGPTERGRQVDVAARDTGHSRFNPRTAQDQGCPGSNCLSLHPSASLFSVLAASQSNSISIGVSVRCIVSARVASRRTPSRRISDTAFGVRLSICPRPSSGSRERVNNPAVSRSARIRVRDCGSMPSREAKPRADVGPLRRRTPSAVSLIGVSSSLGMPAPNSLAMRVMLRLSSVAVGESGRNEAFLLVNISLSVIALRRQITPAFVRERALQLLRTC